MPSLTSQFCIYEFSKKFDNIQQKNGIWVSGGFEIDKPKAFFRSNYQSGDISAIPAQIRQAVIDGLFEIPNAYQPNPLSDPEFYQKVVNRQLDIAAPPLEDIALIARELGDYCVLAVATRQMDNRGFRSKLVGYRYFWLKTSDLNSSFTQQVDETLTAVKGWMHNISQQISKVASGLNFSDSENNFPALRETLPEQIQQIDGIATLLQWWHDKGCPCFDMNPSSYENGINKSQPYLSQKIIFQEEIISRYTKISKGGSLNLPVLFAPDEQLNYFNLHAQALHLCNTMQKPAWAWNVRKLTKPETFTVVYCADRVSYDQFFNPVPKPIEPSATTRSITTTSGSQISSPHSAQFDPTTLDHSPTQPSSSKPPNASNQDTVNLTKYLKEVASNTESPSLRSLIEFYQKKPPAKNRNLWVNSISQEPLNNPNKNRLESDVRNLTLAYVLTWDIPPSQGQASSQSTEDDFTDQEKKWAIDYLNELLAGISKYENQTTYKQTVRKLKQNIAKVRKSLSGEDDSAGGNGGQPSDLPNLIIKLFMDIASLPYYQWLILPLPPILLLFFSFVPLEINPLSPIIYKIVGVQFFPEPKKDDTQDEETAKLSSDIEKLEAARKFIAENSVTTECEEEGSLATNSECQIYQEIKNKLPEWPQLPEPPQGAVIPEGQSSPPKMLAKTRGKNNPPELVNFLQQSLKVAGAKKVGSLGVFDDTLENAVKEFQKNQTQCDLSVKDDKGQEIKDGQDNPQFDGQAGQKTWQCLSDYVQKKQVITILDYRIESLKQGKNDTEIQEYIQKCKNIDPRNNSNNYIKPEDFIKCLTPTEENQNGS